MENFNFKPFDKVLVRDDGESEWIPQLFSYYYGMGNYSYGMMSGIQYRYCIPYEGNEHLAGTMDAYVEPYEPKDGDFVVMYERYIAICKNPQIDEDGGYKFNVYAYSRLPYDDKFYFSMPCTKQEELRLATEKEKQLFLSKLHEIRKKWNAEKKCIEDEWTPKDGDFVYDKNSTCNYIYIFRKGKNNYLNIHYALYNLSSKNCKVDDCCDKSNSLRKATEEEKQQLLDALHKEGKDWNADKKEVVELKWKPKDKEIYWCINAELFVERNEFSSALLSDYNKSVMGNCFRTYEEAEAMAEKFRELIQKNNMCNNDNQSRNRKP